MTPTASLSGDETAKRLAQFGYNEIQEKEEPLWHRIFRGFWGPIPWMIEAAAILSGIVQKWDDFVIIAIMLLVNAGLDFFQEHRALNALKALKQRLTAETIVLRDGKFRTIPARELVPGDIVKWRIGNIVSADVQLLQGDYLSLDQSALTGESLPVNKKTNEVACASTIVKQGEMLAVVVNTAANTNFHTVVALVSRASLEERSHFQKMVIRIGDFLILIMIALVILIVMISLFRHEHFLAIARFALVLTVAAIPVALPAVLSVTMAVGAMKLARRQAIVSRLTAIEELAGVGVFCSEPTAASRCPMPPMRHGPRRQSFSLRRVGGYQRGDQAGAHRLRAHEKLRDLPHRRNRARDPVHDGEHRAVQLLSGDGAGDHPARAAAQRYPDPHHRLRQHQGQPEAGALEHARAAHGCNHARRDWGWLPRSACSAFWSK